MKTKTIVAKSYETPNVNVFVVTMSTIIAKSNPSGETPGDDDPE